ncbi:MAG: hypothetical protein PUF67_03485 [Firmicutes bacterium]|nr:hypothetical protein [Bacillota bacterium]
MLNSKRLLLILVFLVILCAFCNVSVLADGAVFTCADLKQTWSEEKKACVSCESVGKRWNDNLMMCVGDDVKLTCEDDDKVWDEDKQACMPCEFYGLTFDDEKYTCVSTDWVSEDDNNAISDDEIIDDMITEEVIETADVALEESDAVVDKNVGNIIYVNDDVYNILSESDSIFGKKMVVSKDSKSYIIYLNKHIMIDMDGILIFMGLMLLIMVMFVGYLLIVNQHKGEYYRYRE